MVGGKDANADARELSMGTGALKRTFSSNMPLNGKQNGQTAAANGHSNGVADLAGLDLNAPSTSEPKMLKAPNLASAAHLSPGWEQGFNKLLVRSDGVLYEDGQLQIGVRSEYRGQMACLITYFKNKTPATMSSFTTTLDLDENEKTNLTWDVKNLPDSTIVQGGQSQQVVMFEAKKIFEKCPTVRISYLAGALQALTLKLPVAIHKFMDPAELTAEDFFKRWKQIGGAPREAQAIFGVNDKGDRQLTESFVTKTVEGFRWRVLDMVDPNPKNVVGASVLHTSQGGKFGCLMRLEPNYGQQVSHFVSLYRIVYSNLSQMIRLTVRATDDSVPAVLLKYMQERLAAGISTAPERFEPPSREQISDSFRNVMVT